MKIVKCNSIEKGIKAALKITTKWGDQDEDSTTDVWYRGTKDNSFNLQPSVHWKNVVEDEESALITFQQSVSHLIDTSGFSQWDYYYLARHHGLPTRLLDWSEGLMHALFFAFDNWDGSSDPCMWLLRPHLLNAHVLGASFIPAPGSKNHTSTKVLNDWLTPITFNHQKNKKKWSNKYPIAIYPKTSNPRMIGQLGTFTLHGTKKKPLNKYINDDIPKADNILARIDFVGLNPEETKRKLWYMGLRQRVIYPDPDHLAQDITYAYKL